MIAVNTLNIPSAFTANTGTNASGLMRLLFVNQWVEVASGQFADILEGYGSRVYIVDTSTADCPATDHAKILPQNILINPSFEESVNVGWPFGYEAYMGADHGATFFRDASHSAHGRYSAKMVTPSSERGLHIELVPILLCGDMSGTDTTVPPCSPTAGGQRASISLWAIGQTAGLQLSVGGMDNGVGSVFTSTVCSLTLGWSPCQPPSFAVPNGTGSSYLRVWVELVSVGTAWIDLVQATVTMMKTDVVAHVGS